MLKWSGGKRVFYLSILWKFQTCESEGLGCKSAEARLLSSHGDLHKSRQWLIPENPTHLGIWLNKPQKAKMGKCYKQKEKFWWELRKDTEKTCYFHHIPHNPKREIAVFCTFQVNISRGRSQNLQTEEEHLLSLGSETALPLAKSNINIISTRIHDFLIASPFMFAICWQNLYPVAIPWFSWQAETMPQSLPEVSKLAS